MNAGNLSSITPEMIKEDIMKWQFHFDGTYFKDPNMISPNPSFTGNVTIAEMCKDTWEGANRTKFVGGLVDSFFKGSDALDQFYDDNTYWFSSDNITEDQYNYLKQMQKLYFEGKNLENSNFWDISKLLRYEKIRRDIDYLNYFGPGTRWDKNDY
jgi:hypothetical protein